MAPFLSHPLCSFRSWEEVKGAHSEGTSDRERAGRPERDPHLNWRVWKPGILWVCRMCCLSTGGFTSLLSVCLCASVCRRRILERPTSPAFDIAHKWQSSDCYPSLCPHPSLSPSLKGCFKLKFETCFIFYASGDISGSFSITSQLTLSPRHLTRGHVCSPDREHAGKSMWIWAIQEPSQTVTTEGANLCLLHEANNRMNIVSLNIFCTGQTHLPMTDKAEMSFSSLFICPVSTVPSQTWYDYCLIDAWSID